MKSGAGCDYVDAVSAAYRMIELISELGRFVIPPVYVKFSTHKQPILLSQARSIRIDRAGPVRISNELIPDIELAVGEKKLLIILRTQDGLSEEGIGKVIEYGVSAIMIDINENDAADSELTDLILGCTDEKIWIYNRAAESCLESFLSASDRRRVTMRGTELIVEHCPVAERSGDGRRFANYIRDCFCCEYFIDRMTVYNVPKNDPRSYSSKEYILCSGKNKVSTLEDLEKFRLQNQATEASETK